MNLKKNQSQTVNHLIRQLYYKLYIRKGRIYNATILVMLQYSSETWALTKANISSWPAKKAERREDEDSNIQLGKTVMQLSLKQNF